MTKKTGWSVQAAITDPLKWQPRINVSQEAIDHSKRNDANWCMLAMGIGYSIRGATRIVVDSSVCRFNFQGNRYVYTTPPAAARKVYLFDAEGVRPEPWTVRLKGLIGVRPVINRGPKGHNKTGKYKEQYEKRKCGAQTSRRWKGVKLPFTVEEIKKLDEKN